MTNRHSSANAGSDEPRISSYTGGLLAISAGVGSNNPHPLASLAARLIADGHIAAQAEVLLLAPRPAIDDLTQQIEGLLVKRGLPLAGYHVCTLHQLAHSILRQQAEQEGRRHHLVVIDESEAQTIMRQVAEGWIAAHRPWWESFLPMEGIRQREQAEARWQRETVQLGRQITRHCKHLRLGPDEARNLAAAQPHPPEFLLLGLDLYAEYTLALQARRALDFDDLLWQALDALQQPSLAAALRQRWPYLLEDEAQASSPLQERLLQALVGDGGNWVRLGHPNQAVNSTFTTADPRQFARFCERADVLEVAPPASRNVAPSLVALSDDLVQWASEQHPEPAVRPLAFLARSGSSPAAQAEQEWPTDADSHVHIATRPFADVETEAASVAVWAVDYMRRHPDRTAAILCPAQWQGARVVEALKAMPSPVPYDDLMRSTPLVQNMARVLAATCDYLSDPASIAYLAELYSALTEGGYLHAPSRVRQEPGLQQLALPEASVYSMLFPRRMLDLWESLAPMLQLQVEDMPSVQQFATLVNRWTHLTDLPIDQLVTKIGGDLFKRRAEKAICQTLARDLRSMKRLHPAWRLPRYGERLRQLLGTWHSFSTLSLADAGYAPQPGRLAVTTIYKARDLEWDAVYLICVDSLEFPSSREDTFRDELYFLPGRAPVTEAIQALERLAANGELSPEEAEREEALHQARLEYIAERLRLLHLGITRARLDLSLTWSQLNGKRPVQPAEALLALRETHLREISPR
ncbi:MAG: UvrD-helicase domain-containing protein [Chloroflexi bacterium]|nr:UvrD-helicase domain-containing protein [Chloroflexota bacterium]